MIWMYMLGAVVVGVMFSFQPTINAVMAKTVQSPLLATSISVTITLLCALALMPLMGSGNMRPATLATLPWWVILGGVIGTFVVAGGIIIAPVTGALLFFVCVVTGQLLGAAFSDHIGAFGLPQKPLSWLRVAGLSLVVAGVIIVRKG